MSEELLKKYAGAAAEGTSYSTEEEQVVEDGLAAGGTGVGSEDLERWGQSPAAEAAYASLGHHGEASGPAEPTAAAPSVVAAPQSAPMAAESAPMAAEPAPAPAAEPTGLGARIRKLFGG